MKLEQLTIITKTRSGIYNNLIFSIFSDDPAQVRENIETGHPTIFAYFNGSDKDHEDMRLMSFCRHHIIANSSFSWCGMRGCARTPKEQSLHWAHWFNDPTINTIDFIPESWLRI